MTKQSKSVAYGGETSLQLSIVYEDDDLIEIRARLDAGDWACTALVYESATHLGESATQLLGWCSSPKGRFLFGNTGINPHNGGIQLEFRITDMSGHVSCVATLRSMTLGSEVPPEMTISIPAEIGLIERFARETLSLAAGRKGVATLLGPPV